MTFTVGPEIAVAGLKLRVVSEIDVGVHGTTKTNIWGHGTKRPVAVAVLRDGGQDFICIDGTPCAPEYFGLKWSDLR